MSSNPEAKPTDAPTLRFPGFEGEWKYEPLFGLVSLITKKAGVEKYTPMSITTGVGLVSQVEKFGREIAGAQYKNYLVINKFDFAYNKSSTKEYPEGYIAMHTADYIGAVPNSIFTCFRVKRNESDPFYLNYLFQTNLHGKWLRKFIAVGARANGALNVDNFDLLNAPVPIPTGSKSIQEQTHIAACLSSLDAIIKAQADKLAALRQHKTGLMQQLFPAEGETVPKLRFPEFGGAGEWEIKTIGEIASKVGSGITPNGGEKNYSSSGRPFVRSQNVGWGELLLDDIVYISDAIHSSFSSTEIKSGDILLNITGASIGRSAVANPSIAGGNVNQHVCIIRVPKKAADFYFINQMLLSDLGQEQIESFQAGGNRQGLNFAQIRSFKIPIPSLPEQTRIANCLSSLDALIDTQSRNVAELKTFKRGLMQGLFPAAAQE